jgi:hypothetical protein
MNLGDEWEVEAGSTQILARFAENSPNTVLAALPFATVGWRDGDNTVRYRIATEISPSQAGDDTAAQAWLPRLSVRNGQLKLEHGLHQEIGWERRTDSSDVAVVLFADSIENPVMEAMRRLAAGNSMTPDLGAELLYDPASGMVRTAGPRFSTAGIVANVEHKLPHGNQVRVSYANGGALTLPTAAEPMELAQLLASARARRVQSCSISLSGTLDGSGTRWRATYRWQPEDTVSSVASFSQEAAEPYLNVQFRRPIHKNRDGEGGVEALLNLRNLLAQGYRPYILSDGSMLVFAQDQRGISGGLAFNF